MESKVLNLDQLIKATRKKRKVIFTHGVFDLLHIGHMEMLRLSKNQGGLLVVGVDHDFNVSIYKREPVMSQDHRVRMLSYLNVVDYLLPLPRVRDLSDLEFFYVRFYAMLRPDVFTYGDNIGRKQHIRKNLKDVGIQDVLVNHRYSGITTTGNIEKIVNRFNGSETEFNKEQKIA